VHQVCLSDDKCALSESWKLHFITYQNVTRSLVPVGAQVSLMKTGVHCSKSCKLHCFSTKQSFVWIEVDFLWLLRSFQILGHVVNHLMSILSYTL